MALEETSPRKPENAGTRLWRSRWTLAAASVFAFVFAYLEPERTPFALLSVAAIFIVASLFPRPSPQITLSDRSPRRNVWPDNSMKAVTEALQYPVCILDSEGILRYANTATTSAFGTPIIGDPVSVTFRRPEVARLVAKAIAENAVSSMEFDDHILRDRWFLLQVGPAPKAGGGPAEFFLLSFLDQTEARRTEQMRSDFIANASHELRTPLASLRGFIETIKGPAASDPRAMTRFLDIMLDQAERMSRLIDDLLSLSRIEMKAHVKPQGIVLLDDVLGNVANALQPLAEKLGVVIEKRLAPVKLAVAGDRDELIQVFENLVENACKYGLSGGKVEIATKILPPVRDGQSERIEVSVRDWGPGISDEHLPRLTERFYRVDVSSSRDKQGTGLGLAIVKHILNRHGARLAIASRPGEGSTFSVVLPLHTSAVDVEGG